MSDNKKEEKKQTFQAVVQEKSSDGWEPQPLKIALFSNQDKERKRIENQ